MRGFPEAEIMRLIREKVAGIEYGKITLEIELSERGEYVNVGLIVQERHRVSKLGGSSRVVERSCGTRPAVLVKHHRPVAGEPIGEPVGEALERVMHLDRSVEDDMR